MGVTPYHLFSGVCLHNSTMHHSLNKIIIFLVDHVDILHAITHSQMVSYVYVDIMHVYMGRFCNTTCISRVHS